MLKISKQKTYAIGIILILFILSVNFFITNKNEISKVCIKDNCFQVELAKTDLEKSKGLMFRKELDKDNGMLFIYNSPIITSFWMKNTLIPLDIIWILDNEIVYVFENALPCIKGEECILIVPEPEANYVLEINSGLVKEYNLTIEDKVNLF